MSFAKQLEWLASYNRDTGELSVHGAKECGYGDLVRVGYVVDRGAGTIIDLHITEAGKMAVAAHSRGVDAVAKIKPAAL